MAIEGKSDDYLYLIVDGKYYRLTKAQIVDPPENAVNKANGWSKKVEETFEQLEAQNVTIANLPRHKTKKGHIHPDSCTCVLVNLDSFEPDLTQKIERATKESKEA